MNCPIHLSSNCIYGVFLQVTINHFDIPLSIAELGGWTNTSIINTFANYAEFLLKTFGDRVS